jgi:hypothetical protein
MMSYKLHRKRRWAASFLIALIIASIGVWVEVDKQAEIDSYNQEIESLKTHLTSDLAVDVLAELPIKGRAPKTGYKRDQFGNGWRKTGDCTTRELILARDVKDAEIENCKVLNGTLEDPYTGKTILFVRGPETSDDVQIDHVVALSDAWQKGAQSLTFAEREELANDPLELLAVDGPANQDKGAGDAATWLPPNKIYRCSYVARQIAVKKKYSLWVTQSENEAIKNVLKTCPDQRLPIQK